MLPDHKNQPEPTDDGSMKREGIVERFEQDWESGKEPSIEEFLTENGSQRKRVLIDLINIDLERRLKAGEDIVVENYLVRFPDVEQQPEEVNALRERAQQLIRRRQESATTVSYHNTVSEQPIATPRYEILEEVGRGGMGIVYRARHRLLDRQMAVKVCSPGGQAERFQREAQLLASLDSPHIVTVHDFERLSDERMLLAMDWVESSLRKCLKESEGPIAESRVLPWMRQVGAGMQTAAEAGIIHRDLKPSNILIDAQDNSRIADFGLARSVDVKPLTLTDGLMGTPHYMAPEQAEDPRWVDSRADIYSFGATFYHLLTGRPPFGGKSSFSVLFKHKTAPLISPQERNPKLSNHISDLLERCLAKLPADRFPSFTELNKHLQQTQELSPPWMISDDLDLVPFLHGYGIRRSHYLSDRTNEGELDVFAFPRGQTLRIVKGDIVQQEVEALVSSDTSRFAMTKGVSAAIRKAGGSKIKKQARWHKPVRPGRAIITSAGKLPARFVIHGVTAGYADGAWVRPSRDLIAEIMESCFYHADTHNVRSIAFPLLGTVEWLPRHVCLDTMFQFLARKFLHGLTSVQDARIIIYGGTGKSGKCK